MTAALDQHSTARAAPTDRGVLGLSGAAEVSLVLPVLSAMVAATLRRREEHLDD